MAVTSQNNAKANRAIVSYLGVVTTHSLIALHQIVVVVRFLVKPCHHAFGCVNDCRCRVVQVLTNRIEWHLGGISLRLSVAPITQFGPIGSHVRQVRVPCLQHMTGIHVYQARRRSDALFTEMYVYTVKHAYKSLLCDVRKCCFYLPCSPCPSRVPVVADCCVSREWYPVQPRT